MTLQRELEQPHDTPLEHYRGPDVELRWTPDGLNVRPAGRNTSAVTLDPSQIIVQLSRGERMRARSFLTRLLRRPERCEESVFARLRTPGSPDSGMAFHAPIGHAAERIADLPELTIADSHHVPLTTLEQLLHTLLSHGARMSEHGSASARAESASPDTEPRRAPRRSRHRAPEPLHSTILLESSVSEPDALKRALERLDDGGQLQLSAGTFRLRRTLEPRRSVHIMGSPNGTTLELEDGWSFLRVVDHRVHLSDLTFAANPRGMTSGVELHGRAQLELTRSLFTHCRHGVVLRDDARARVHNCQLTDLGGHAIDAEGRTQIDLDTTSIFRAQSDALSLRQRCRATLIEVRVDGGQASGVALHDEAHAHITGGRLEGLARHALLADDRTQVNVENTLMRANTGSAIELQGHTQANITGCECVGNKAHGIHATDQATGTIANNRCVSNSLSGLAFTATAHPSLHRNRCTGNREHGLFITSSATLAVQAQESDRNHLDGVHITSGAHVSFVKIACYRNDRHGIYVEDAQVEVVISISNLNQSDGMHFGRWSRGEVRNSGFDSNNGHGITCSDGAAGALNRNRCTNNAGDGIHIALGATTTCAEDNTGEGNGGALLHDARAPTRHD